MRHRVEEGNGQLASIRMRHRADRGGGRLKWGMICLRECLISDPHMRKMSVESLGIFVHFPTKSE